MTSEMDQTDQTDQAEERSDGAPEGVGHAAGVVDAPDGVYLGEYSPEQFSPMEYVGVEVVLPSTNPVLVLREEDEPHRELHIPIALADGVAIAFAARHILTPKPLTHELMTNVLDGYGLTLEQVRITAVENSSYSAEMVLSGSLGSRVIECRVTDGLCLALRQRLDVPVTAAEEVLFQASIPSRSS